MSVHHRFVAEGFDAASVAIPPTAAPLQGMTNTHDATTSDQSALPDPETRPTITIDEAAEAPQERRGYTATHDTWSHSDPQNRLLRKTV